MSNVIPRALEALAKLNAPIAVVAHDAGAANHISAWFAGLMATSVHGSFAGPASAIFSQQCPWMATGLFNEHLSQCKTLISGTGWAGTFEHDARTLAKQMGCYSIAVIDHWTSYRERFVRNNEETLPDEIWITDDYAKTLAEIEFPDIRIVQMQNMYLENMTAEVRDHQYNAPASSARNVLYVLEPFRESWGTSPLLGEFQALDFFVMNLQTLHLDNNVSIKLRPHPSDAVGKYDQWIESQKDLKITLEHSSTLAESIAWADIVVGCQTYAMVVALAAGKHVISSLPPWGPSCVLPHREILKLADLVH